MNENISQYLFKYMDNPDPRYAIMLKGKWGCGKSFFIQNWIEQYKEKYHKGETVLEPIYISLYGLKETSQITTAIDRVLHPILYSKGAEITKKILKVAGKIVFKTNLDWNDDGNEDLSLETTLDSISLLASNDADKTIGSKLVVFDDLERCLVDMKLLLGYINNFVEHGACHVIIVGDETHTKDDAKEKLIEFKEKTVGREFEVAPDWDEAIEYFIEEVPISEWLTTKKKFILDCFKSTRCDNLRILRRCLYDFSVLYNEINDELLKNGESFMISLLGSFIISYCEYRGEYQDILKNWDWSYIHGLCGDEVTKERISKLQGKYSSIVDSYQIDVLNPNHIKQIVFEIETGWSLKNYVERAINQIRGNVSLFEKLADFYQLSNEEFEKAYNELEQNVRNNTLPDFCSFGKSLAFLVFFDYKQIYPISEDIITHAKKHIAELYASIEDKETLYQQRDSFYQGVSSYGFFYEYPLGKIISDFATKLFEEKDKELKNKMEEVLFNLNDDNVERLIELSDESTPDHSSNYGLTSIFKNIDGDVLADRILTLKNCSIKQLCHFLYQHYMFYYNLSSLSNRYGDDLPILQHVNNRLKKELPKRDCVDKYMLKMLLKYITGAIKRASGNSEPIEIKDI